VAAVGGFALGAVIETALIRPLYERPLYQLMITLGLGFIIIEVVRAVWGRPEFIMPKPAVFDRTGDGCPGEGIGGLFSGCSTVEILGTRIRLYNEMFIILVGAVVLVVITLLIKRTRMGMIIRAGVQDREMVEALGVNVRRVFTVVFALGVALAAFGGVVAAPALGLSTGMGSRVLLLALIAMAVGGLTSFPGAAAGAVLVGLLQQFVIKAGSTGIPVPWSDTAFKPSPSLVPVSVIILMIVVLLVTPEGLFGREE
jgi:branched-chain amino acid transport system permease protein